MPMPAKLNTIFDKIYIEPMLTGELFLVLSTAVPEPARAVAGRAGRW